jgi:hypothetical protein
LQLKRQADGNCSSENRVGANTQETGRSALLFQDQGYETLVTAQDSRLADYFHRRVCVALAAVAIRLAAPWPIWALVGALLGFLIWNWSPAKVFMGDVGSTFLGAVFAGLVLQARCWLPPPC